MEISSVEAVPLSYSIDRDDGLVTGRGDVVTERPMTLVRVTTDDGLVGWGEAFGPPQTNAAMLEEMIADMVVGTDPFSTESLHDRAYAGLYHFAGRGPLQSVLAGVDIALWDLKGKEMDRPVHHLLGGPTRSEVTPYASTMMRYDRETDEVEEDSTAQLRTAVDEGFAAAKIKVGRNVEDDVRRVERARDVLGSDASLMVDMNGNYRTDQAIRAVEALEPYDLQWIEEPILPHNVDEYDKIKCHTETPLAAGEAAYSRFEFNDLVESDGIDVVQPDMSKCGLSEAKYVAKRATTANVGVSPHCWNGPISLAAAIQFAAAVPAYPHTGRHPEPFFVEVDRSDNALRDELLESPLDTTGPSIEIPDGPGLGVEPDPAVIERYRV
jgi:D-galactarolactone cycloisomerase